MPTFTSIAIWRVSIYIFFFLFIFLIFLKTLKSCWINFVWIYYFLWNSFRIGLVKLLMKKWRKWICITFVMSTFLGVIFSFLMWQSEKGFQCTEYFSWFCLYLCKYKWNLKYTVLLCICLIFLYKEVKLNCVCKWWLLFELFWVCPNYNFHHLAPQILFCLFVLGNCHKIYWLLKCMHLYIVAVHSCCCFRTLLLGQKWKFKCQIVGKNIYSL